MRKELLDMMMNATLARVVHDLEMAGWTVTVFKTGEMLFSHPNVDGPVTLYTAREIQKDMYLDPRFSQI